MWSHCIGVSGHGVGYYTFYFAFYGFFDKYYNDLERTSVSEFLSEIPWTLSAHWKFHWGRSHLCWLLLNCTKLTFDQLMNFSFEVTLGCCLSMACGIIISLQNLIFTQAKRKIWGNQCISLISKKKVATQGAACLSWWIFQFFPTQKNNHKPHKKVTRTYCTVGMLKCPRSV